MNILVVNDDGIEAAGIRVLAGWARKLGDVTVVAPRTQQSAKSHSINIQTAFRVESVDWLPGVKAVSVDSTPADCVRVAERYLRGQYDLVLAGINRGYNMGSDIAYSGTCAAISEAAYAGWRAVAFSTWPDSCETAGRHLDRIWAFIEQHNLLDICPLLNVNIPPEGGGILITRQGGTYFRDTYDEQEDRTIKARGFSVYDGSFDPQIDYDAVFNGRISVTPLSVDRTDLEAFRKMLGEVNG
ncbi:MAG: 5'/3'-nucleotidase SurE [Lachnospiraceae bacterium]|nr:5'/3'-nucleotidase SurE [Lachnospiraceae bacterium]